MQIEKINFIKLEDCECPICDSRDNLIEFSAHDNVVIQCTKCSSNFAMDYAEKTASLS